MKRQKAFDCVVMKDQIQARHREEYQGMSDEERRRSVEGKLATSDDLVARKWRKLPDRDDATRAVP